MPKVHLLLGAFLLLPFMSCQAQKRHSELAFSDTVVELRVIKGNVRRVGSNANDGKPYARERLAAGESLRLDGDSLSYLRRDSGGTYLLSGPAGVTVLTDGISLESGRLFIDTQGGASVRVDTPLGPLEIAEGRSSIQLDPEGRLEIYVLRGTARHNALRARSGDRLTVSRTTAGRIEQATAWEDWTGGLATADPTYAPAPFGVGTISARKPSDVGSPRFALSIQRLSVNVTLDHDFATTEVDQTFSNPSNDTVEGMYSFRTPPTAILSRFGVDRDGLLVWGRVKEKREAKAQYESHVYEGSTEDPALLEWVARGIYQARLYPIAAGTTRRLVTRYSEWLGRQGRHGERRLYVYPMAATGTEASLPVIDELTVHIDWEKSSATRIRAPLGTVRRGKKLIYKARDVRPRSDFSLELFDAGQKELVAYRTKHELREDELDRDTAPGFAEQTSKQEADYLVLPLAEPESAVPEAGTEPGVDLSIVVDSSAATDPSSFSVARNLVAALLSALGPHDRASLFTGDTLLLPVRPESSSLQVMDPPRRKAYLAALANAPLGGATDLGAMLAAAAERLDAKRRGAVIYVGDGRPSVGEMLSKPLRERLSRLPPNTRILAAGVGTQVNTPLLEGLVRGGPLQLVNNGYDAAVAALQLLESVSHATWQGVVAQAQGVDRILPRLESAVPSGDNVLLVGRISGEPGKVLQLSQGGQSRRAPIKVVTLTDLGDARRRWGEARFTELGEQQAGRLAQVDLARRYGLVTHLTSLYVATRAEATRDGSASSASVPFDPEEQANKEARWKPWTAFSGSLGFLAPKEATYAPSAMASAAATDSSDSASESANKEGGTGTRAKGEEGAMQSAPAALEKPAVRGGSNSSAKASSRRYAVGEQNAPRHDQAPGSPQSARQAAIEEAKEFGMIGALGDEQAPAAAPAPAAAVVGNAFADPAKREGPMEVGGRDLSLRPGGGIGVGHGSGFGSGKGRLGGSARSLGAAVTLEPIQVTGRFAPEVAARILRQHYSEYRACYEGGLARNPNLEGNVTLKLRLDKTGRVSHAVVQNASLPDAGVIHCLEQAVRSIAFPQPEADSVILVSPFVFRPAIQGDRGDKSTDASQPPRPPGELGKLTHTASPCSLASNLPLVERRKLWGERLAGSQGPEGVLQVYQVAIERCEASTFYDRQMLLYAMVDRLATIDERVVLYRLLLSRKAAARVVYQAILTRIQGAEQMKQFHLALGIVEPDEALLARILGPAMTPAERIAKLRALLIQWPEDVGLSLRLLEAFEDSNALDQARAVARKLRRRSDLTAHLATLVGEFYLRAAEHGTPSERERDAAEARRSFGEIVEFAPEDPAARRTLADLLISHGFYEEAMRQYQTLEILVPDDTTVALRMARAAFGLGKVEEALRWTEKAKATSSPDGQGDLERAASLWSNCYLSWALLQAKSAGSASDEGKLLARAARTTRENAEPGQSVVVTWSHPELSPTVFVRTLGGEIPARNFPLLGIAEARLLESESLEIRLDPELSPLLARLGAEVTLTATLEAAGAPPKIAHKTLRFGSTENPKATLRVALANGDLHEEVAR